MQLVEKHIIRENKPEFKILDELCYKSKNLYNSTLYAIRQEFCNSGLYLSYYKVQKEFQEKNNFDYKQLPAKVSQQTMRLVDQNFSSFFSANKDWKENPGKYNGKPKIPKYLDSMDGRFMVVYTSQAISKRALMEGFIVLSGLPEIKIRVKVFNKKINQVRIIPRVGKYVIEVVYTVPDVPKKQDNGVYAAIDLGVNNLATITTNLERDKPLVVDGRKVKSINHHYNKLKSKYQSQIPTYKIRKTTKRLRRIETKRENKINDYFHKASRFIVNQLVSKGVNTLIIGKNNGWKQDTIIGKIGNQNFVQIPFNKFISMLEYKCGLVGIDVKVVTEEYTSKCSFLDNEEIGKHDIYLGKRVKRGLFKSSTGKTINADVNGSYNILRKCKPSAFNAKGVQGVVVHPHILCFA
jgi:putative transposase